MKLVKNPRVSDSRARILEAATVVFAHQGFHGTSTREIARLANLSEVTLFRHYPNKEEVFLGALGSNLDIVANRSSFLRKAGNASLSQDVLLQIFALLHDVATYTPQTIKLIVIACLEVHGAAEEMCSTRLGAIFREITVYLNTNMKAGRLRSVNPDLVAATMALSAIAQTAIQRFHPAQTETYAKVQKTLDEFTAFWKTVLIPRPDSPISGRGTDLSLPPGGGVTIGATEV